MFLETQKDVIKSGLPFHDRWRATSGNVQKGINETQRAHHLLFQLETLFK